MALGQTLARAQGTGDDTQFSLVPQLQAQAAMDRVQKQDRLTVPAGNASSLDPHLARRLAAGPIGLEEARRTIEIGDPSRRVQDLFLGNRRRGCTHRRDDRQAQPASALPPALAHQDFPRAVDDVVGNDQHPLAMTRLELT